MKATRFDQGLSLSLDDAVITAEAADLAARDHWATARHHAYEAIRQAAERDRALERIAYLDSLIPTGRE